MQTMGGIAPCIKYLNVTRGYRLLRNVIRGPIAVPLGGGKRLGSNVMINPPSLTPGIRTGLGTSFHIGGGIYVDVMLDK